MTVGVVCTLLLCFIPVRFVAGQTPVLDPQSLVGEWQGNWIDPRDTNNKGSYFMTIKRVEGNVVVTHLYIVGRGVFDGERSATLSGNTMIMQTQSNRAEFVIEGRQMRGTTRNISSGIVVQEISLVKK